MNVNNFSSMLSMEEFFKKNYSKIRASMCEDVYLDLSVPLKKYLKMGEKGQVEACIIYLTVQEGSSERALGRFLGYSGGGASEEGWFVGRKDGYSSNWLIDEIITDFDIAKDNDLFFVFEWLHMEHAQLFDYDEDYLFSPRAIKLIDDDGEGCPDGSIVYEDLGVDYSLLSSISKKWPLSLKFKG